MKLRFTDSAGSPAAAAGDEGIFVPLLALCLIAIFTFLGLAVDGGRMYAARLSAQSWADATSYAVASRIALAVNNFSAIPAGVVTSAEIQGRLFARSNAFLNGYDPARTTPDVQINTVGNNIEVVTSISYNLPLFVMQVVPRIGSVRTIRTIARSQITPALGAIVLDASGSMNCPSVTDCSCFPNCGTNANQKFENLLTIVDQEFMSRFDRARDMISVSMYDKVSNQLVTINPTGGWVGSTLPAAASTAYTNRVQQFDAGNLTQALITAEETLRGPFNANPDLAPFIAVLSDGAPTATCLRPVDTVAQIPPAAWLVWWGISAPPPPPPPANRVYCFWEVIWEGYLGDPTTAPLLRRNAISPLASAVNYSSVPSSYNWDTDDPVFGQPACSTISFGGWLWPTSTPPHPDDSAYTEIARCLRSYRFTDIDGVMYPRNLPAPSNTFRDAPIGGNPTANSHPHWGANEGSNWRRIFYNTAVAQADAIRNRGYVFFTIGLGQDLGAGGDYNSLANILEMKTGLLNRIALPYQGFSPGATIGFQNWGRSRFIQDYIDDDTQAKGEFFPILDTSNAAIAAQFRQLARRVKLRMVQ